jgi:hypothetical protein
MLGSVSSDPIGFIGPEPKAFEELADALGLFTSTNLQAKGVIVFEGQMLTVLDRVNLKRAGVFDVTSPSRSTRAEQPLKSLRVRPPAQTAG